MDSLSALRLLTLSNIEAEKKSSSTIPSQISLRRPELGLQGPWALPKSILNLFSLRMPELIWATLTSLPIHPETLQARQILMQLATLGEQSASGLAQRMIGAQHVIYSETFSASPLAKKYILFGSIDHPAGFPALSLTTLQGFNCRNSEEEGLNSAYGAHNFVVDLQANDQFIRKATSSLPLSVFSVPTGMIPKIRNEQTQSEYYAWSFIYAFPDQYSNSDWMRFLTKLVQADAQTH